MIKKIPSLTLITLLTYFLSYLSHSATIDESLNNYLAPISNLVAGFVFYSFIVFLLSCNIFAELFEEKFD